MPRTRWLLAGAAVAVVAVALLVAALGRGSAPGTATTSPGASASRSASPATSRTPAATTTATPSVAAATPTVTPEPVATPAPATPPPRATGPPLRAWTEFLAHLNEARATVEGLNTALTTAAQAQDPDAVRSASVDILDFVDVERDWLRDHPPADCYAAAHGAASAMLDAYGTAADRFIDWTETGGGFGGLVALGAAVESADLARAAFTSFVAALEGTTCPG